MTDVAPSAGEKERDAAGRDDSAGARSAETTAAFATLLDYLKRSRGLDLSGYKSASLMRRIDKRMATLGVHDYPSYVEYLEDHPDEFKELFNELLINVTGFSRDDERGAAEHA